MKLDYKAVKVRHIMADGTVRDSIEGVMIPDDHPYYDVMAEILYQKAVEMAKESKSA